MDFKGNFDIPGFFFVHRSQNSVPQIFAKLSFLAKTQFPKIQKLSFYDIFNFELWILTVRMKAFYGNEKMLAMFFYFP